MEKHKSFKNSTLAAPLVRIFCLVSEPCFIFCYIQANKQSSTPNHKPQAIIVLGGGVENAQPTPSLTNRLDTAALYAHQYPSALMIVSGGSVFGESYIEADIMKNYLFQHHPKLKNPIKTENSSTSTALNLAYSQEILFAQGISNNKPIAIVTSDFHLPRAKAIAARQGYSNIISVGAAPPYIFVITHGFVNILPI